MSFKEFLRMILPKKSVAQVTAAFTEQFREIEEAEAEKVSQKTEKIDKLKAERDASQAELDSARKAREWLTKGLTGES